MAKTPASAVPAGSAGNQEGDADGEEDVAAVQPGERAGSAGPASGER
jgi:hypothetical protein